MIEYLFFNKKISKLFTQIVQEKGIVWQQDHEAVQDAIIIKIPEDEISDELWDELDKRYDELSDQDQHLLEQEEALGDDQSAAGIYLQLANGKQTIAKVDPAIMNRILGVLSIEEFNEFLEVIVSSVENPDDTAICQNSLIDSTEK
ncbi:MAG: hypothetical protein KAH22_01765 [Thiotrichaceae bacterium]|nr:hypothetical protein [Thiotrichaceae bacterium]